MTFWLNLLTKLSKINSHLIFLGLLTRLYLSPQSLVELNPFNIMSHQHYPTVAAKDAAVYKFRSLQSHSAILIYETETRCLFLPCGGLGIRCSPSSNFKSGTWCARSEMWSSSSVSAPRRASTLESTLESEHGTLAAGAPRPECKTLRWI